MDRSLTPAETAGWTDRISLAVPAATLRRLVAYVLPSLAALVATQNWFRPGTFVATGDVAPFLRSNLFTELPTLWGHSLVGGGSVSFQPTARAPELALLGLSDLLGRDAMFAQRLLYSILSVAVVVGVVSFVRVFVDRPVPSAVAGLIGFFNPYVLQHLPNPLPLWTIALTSLSGALILRAARGDDVPGWAIACASVAACYLAVNPPLLAVLGAWVVAVAALGSALTRPGGTRRAFEALARALPWAIVLNLWWVVPLIATLATRGTGYRVVAETDVLTWTWTHQRLSIPNVLSLDGHWGWAYPEYFPYAARIDGSVVSFLRFGLPVLALSAPIVAPRDRRRPTLVLVACIAGLAFLAKGLHPPIGTVNLFLYEHVPGMWLLREPMSKLGPVLDVLLCTLVAITLQGVGGRTTRSGRPAVAPRVVAAVLCAGVLLFNYPLITGAVVPDDRPVLPSAHVTVPTDWQRLASVLNARPDDGKALVLPLDDFYQVPTTWGYYGVDQIPRSLLARPTIQPLPGSYYADGVAFEAEVEQVQTAVLAGDPNAVAPLLRSLGVSYVIVRRDLVTDLPGRPLPDASALASGLADVPGLSAPTSFGVADVYRVERDEGAGGPLLRTLIPVHASEVSDPTFSFAVGSLPATSGAVSHRRAPRVVSVSGPTRSSTWFSADGGAVRLMPRLIGPQLVRFTPERAPDGDVSLRVDRAAGLVVDGRPLDRGEVPAIDLGNVADVAAIRTGRGLFPVVDGSVVAAVDTRSPVVAFARSGASRSLSAVFSPVGDCNAFDPRTPSQVGISAAPLPPSGGGGVVLRALAHAACVHADVAAPTDGPVLVEFAYRSVSGTPARSCLWATVARRCLPAPPLSPTAGWHRSVIALVPGSSTGRIDLYLYADGSGTGVATRVEYRNVRVTSLARSATGTLVLSAPPASVLRVTDGMHELRAEVDTTASLERMPSVVHDCHAYDGRTMQEAGLEATALPGDGIRLRAATHAACVSTPVSGFVPGATYRLRLDARSLQGLPARVCLWEDGPDRCAPLAPLPRRSRHWATFDAAVTPDPGTTALRLFLYADGDRTGGQTTIVEYRNVDLSAIAPFGVAIADVATPSPPPPAIRWTRSGGSSFHASIGRAGTSFVLALAESTSPGWTLTGLPERRTAKRVVVDGYGQGWLISPGPPVEVSIVYGPDRWFHRASAASAIAALFLPVAIVRRRRRPGPSSGWVPV